MTLPARPAKQRSWLTRGYYSASPWARPIHPLVTETWVTFSRSARTKSGMGGYTGSSRADYFSAWCHVEQDTMATFRGGESGASTGVGLFQTRYYTIELPVEALDGDTSLLPAKGDRVIFTDQMGRFVDMPIGATPNNPVNTQEFVSIVTEEFS